jgi:hypothetical protein
MPLPEKGYAAHRCVVCGGFRPKWTLTRIGDVVTAWACAWHLDLVLSMMTDERWKTISVVRHEPDDVPVAAAS